MFRPTTARRPMTLFCEKGGWRRGKHSGLWLTPLWPVSFTVLFPAPFTSRTNAATTTSSPFLHFPLLASPSSLSFSPPRRRAPLRITPLHVSPQHNTPHNTVRRACSPLHISPCASALLFGHNGWNMVAEDGRGPRRRSGWSPNHQ